MELNRRGLFKGLFGAGATIVAVDNGVPLLAQPAKLVEPAKVEIITAMPYNNTALYEIRVHKLVNAGDRWNRPGWKVAEPLPMTVLYASTFGLEVVDHTRLGKESAWVAMGMAISPEQGALMGVLQIKGGGK